jgi:hypothetical protein
MGTNDFKEQPGASSSAAVEANTCPKCGHNNRVGELACNNCGAPLVTIGRTRAFKDVDEATDPKNWPTGEVFVTGQKPILFDIDGQVLSLPIADVLIVGRSSGVTGDASPDVDLSKFNAEARGVSRNHARIKRKGNLIYVADLGSTNGTLLNGRKLNANNERVLRNGDELQLGRMKIKVQF